MRVVLRAVKVEFLRHPSPIIPNIYASCNKRYWSPQIVLLRFFQMSGLGFSSNICTLQPSKTSQECNIVFTKLVGASPRSAASPSHFYCFFSYQNPVLQKYCLYKNTFSLSENCLSRKLIKTSIFYDFCVDQPKNSFIKEDF